MKKTIIGLIAVFALSITAVDVNAQAGGITKGGKTQSWKFADSISTSTVALFPSYDYKTPSFTGDSIVVKAAQAVTYVKLPELTATRRVTLSDPQSYFKGGEVLYIDAYSDASRSLIIQQHGFKFDTFTVNRIKKLSVVWNGTHWEVVGVH